MNRLKTIIIAFICFCCIKCNDIDFVPKSSFDSPFPKRNKNLTYILGEIFLITNGKDTIKYNVSFRKPDRYNFIVNQSTNDTIFSGTVCQYKGLYYFNEQINDTAYWIYAVEINYETIKGLNTGLEQMFLLDEIIEKGGHKNIVKFIDKEKDIIILRPDKIELRKIYTSIIDSLPAYTLIEWEPKLTGKENIEEERTETVQTDIDQFEIISKIYPNPAKDHCTLVLQENNHFKFDILDNSGRIISTGQLNNRINRIDLSNFSNGIYLIRVHTADTKEIETIKLVIEK